MIHTTHSYMAAWAAQDGMARRAKMWDCEYMRDAYIISDHKMYVRRGISLAIAYAPRRRSSVVAACPSLSACQRVCLVSDAGRTTVVAVLAGRNTYTLR